MQEEKTTKWAGVGIYVVQRGINKHVTVEEAKIANALIVCL